VTFTTGVEKIWHPDPWIGFLSQANAVQEVCRINSQFKPDGIYKSAIQSLTQQLPILRKQWFNMIVDAAVDGACLFLVAVIILLSVR